MNGERPRDEGAMLLFALIIITTVALVTGTVLAHSWTNLRATTSLQGVAATGYAADGAAKLAIDNLRMGSSAPGYVDSASSPRDNPPWVYSNNIDGTGCFGLDGANPRDTLTLDKIQPRSGEQAADTSARVKCTVVPGTGLFGSGGGVETNDQNGFLRAITVFDGDLTIENNSYLQVRGGVASNGRIDADNAAGTGLFTNGYVWANQGCLGSITSKPAPDCSHADVTDPSIDDIFTSTAGITVRDAASQACGSFQPGYYASAKALTDRVNACGTSVFVPGDYYFGFRDEATGAGNNVWTIDNTVIGGELIGSGEPPGRCRNPIDDPTADGVRFVFGGNSRIVIGQNAHVELCGTYSATAPPVVLQQQKTGTSSSPGNASGTATTVATAGSTPAWTTPPTSAALSAVGGATGVWSGPGNNKTAKATLSAFNVGSVPAGATLTSAKLRVRHQEASGGQLKVDTKVGATVVNTTNLTTTPAYPVAPAPLYSEIDLTAALSAAALSGTLGTMSIDLTLSGKDLALSLDYVELVVQYTTWSLAAATDNDFLTGFGNSFKGDFVLQGALYAPKGRVDVNFGNNSDTVVAFRYGMAVRDALLAGHPQVLYGYPLVSIPDQGTGLGKRVTVVDLQVYVCEEASTCSDPSAPLALTVRAKITDPPWNVFAAPPNNEPVPGRRQIEVLSWAEQR